MFKKILFFVFLIFVFLSNSVLAKDIELVHFSDVHLDSQSSDKKVRKFAQTIPMFERAIEKVNKINPSLVLFSGDMINKPLESEFDLFLNKANNLVAPYYVVFGNHDVGVLGGVSKSILLDKINMYSDVKIETSSYFIIKDDYIFIFMDGTTDKIITANGFFSKESLSFLDNTLKNNKDKKAVIIQHFPLMTPFRSFTHEILNKDEYFSVLDKYSNVIMVLAGHYHSPKVIVRNNVAHITTSSMVEYPHAFRYIKVRDNKENIILETKLLADEWQNPNYRNFKEVIKLQK